MYCLQPPLVQSRLKKLIEILKKTDNEELFIKAIYIFFVLLHQILSFFSIENVQSLEIAPHPCHARIFYFQASILHCYSAQHITDNHANLGKAH